MAWSLTRHPHHAAWAASCPAGLSFGLTPARSLLEPIAARPRAQQHTALRVVFPSLSFTSAASSSQAVPDRFKGGKRSQLLRIGYDFGDRRIVAGVHYPSDNYASAAVFNMLPIATCNV